MRPPLLADRLEGRKDGQGSAARRIQAPARLRLCGFAICPVPEVNMGDEVRYRVLGIGDLDLLRTTAEGLFDLPVDAEQSAAFLNSPSHAIVAAIAGGEIVGFASGNVLLHPDKPPAFFVNEVGVRELWQRRGIGRELMLRLMEIARARSCKGIWLGTEPENNAALGLYRSLDGEEVPFVGFGWDDAL
jgi:ribosomal protein S18 acetylase RimI-like enzyme